jgi:hypothetical protein
LQSIPAKRRDVEDWLLKIFEESGQGTARYLKIPQLADDICKLFSDQRPIYYQRSLRVSANPTQLSPDDLPDNATVEGDARLMEELFGSLERKADWKSIKDRFGTFSNSVDVNFSTLKEVAHAIYRASRRTVVPPIQGIIFVAQGPKRYRPILTSAKEVTNEQIDCDFMFVEEAGGQLQNIPKPSEALLTAIRMAVRIRWEIVRPFLITSDVRTQARLDSRKLRSDLQTCFNNVFLEAGFRKNFSKADLVDAFEAPDRERLLNIMEKWDETYPKIWSGIGFADMKETFGEVSAERMNEEDMILLESALQEIGRLNRDFLAMAAARGQLLIQS